MTRLVLASASPRRHALLAQIGLVPDHVTSADIDETPRKKETPRLYVERMAAEKMAAIQDDGFVITADTVVACGRRILGKAEDVQQVKQFLTLLSGRAHQVFTAVSVRSPEGKLVSRTVLTRVTFKRLTEKEMEDYITSQEGFGKAGGYAIQGLAAGFVKRINGSYSAVVGLPLYEVRNMLVGLGYKYCSLVSRGFGEEA